jgi:hypothetical protein
MRRKRLTEGDEGDRGREEGRRREREGGKKERERKRKREGGLGGVRKIDC